MRVPPSPAKESVPALAVGMRLQLAPPFVERKIPSPKYESAELLASPVAARIKLFAGLLLPAWMAIAPIESVAASSATAVHATALAVPFAPFVDFQIPPCAPPM